MLSLIKLSLIIVIIVLFIIDIINWCKLSFSVNTSIWTIKIIIVCNRLLLLYLMLDPQFMKFIGMNFGQNNGEN